MVRFFVGICARCVVFSTNNRVIEAGSEFIEVTINRVNDNEVL